MNRLPHDLVRVIFTYLDTPVQANLVSRLFYHCSFEWYRNANDTFQKYGWSVRSPVPPVELFKQNMINLKKEALWLGCDFSTCKTFRECLKGYENVLLNVQDHDRRVIEEKVEKTLLGFIDLSASHLHFITPNIANCTKITSIDCKRYCLNAPYIRALPTEIENLPFLASLNIHGQGFEELPVNAPFLISLIASCNNLKKVPSSISRLQNLVSLMIGHNKIEVLPDEIGALVHLRTLNINDNLIRELPESLSDLRLDNLNASDNQLSKLPRNVTRLTSLLVLSLGNNLLSQSVAWTAFTRLQLLDLKHNRFTAYPGPFPNISCLFLTDNPYQKRSLPI